MNILDEIAGRTRKRIEEEKRRIPLETVRQKAEEQKKIQKRPDFAFEQALRAEGMSFICEVKKASPSKGLIAPEYLAEISCAVNIPVLRKDFTVDEYMIYQAKAIGADSVLLICAILDDAQLKDYGDLAGELGLSALVEAHSGEEVERALRSGARIIGVNNRDLKTFQVDITTSHRLRQMVPPDILFVSESGIRGTEDIRDLGKNGTDAVLIGETLMRAKNKSGLLQEWKNV